MVRRVGISEDAVILVEVRRESEEVVDGGGIGDHTWRKLG